VLVPIGLNVLSNVLFTPIQFGLRNLPLALLDILVVLGTLVWAIVLLWPLALLAAVALLPYLVWVSIATVLQASITAMNR
jgi:tryptophan-rich sensory protein